VDEKKEKKFQWDYIETTRERKTHSVASGVKMHPKLLEISEQQTK